MWLNNIFIFVFLNFLQTFVSAKLRYDNYSLFKVLPESEHHIKLLQNLQNSNRTYDFWTSPVKSSQFVNILSGPKYKNELESFLNDYGITFEIPITNVQEVIDIEPIGSYTRGITNAIGWYSFYPLESIEEWLQNLVEAYPNIGTLIVGGVSYEGREIKGIKISHGAGKRAIFIEAGIHSNEWITVSSACYIINELLTSEEAEIMAAAKDFDWYIFPVFNPDGYVWAHTKDRFWRKNRRPVGSEFGVDLNRNWNNNWLVAGSSIDPSWASYAGSGPFSEPETRSLSTFIRSIGDKIDLYISFHSFGQLLLLPFGNTTEPQANYYDAINIGRRAMGALSVKYGTQYVAGNIAEAIYEATGGSVDWVKEHLQVPLVYCYELRDKGNFGFLLPADQILPNNQEVMDSVIDLIYQGKRFGYLNNATGIHVSILSFVFIIVAYFL